MSRIEKRFADLKKEGRKGLVTFITAGDPDAEVSRAILRALPDAGADIIELGMPFTDPMADGPAIQAAGLRALKNGATMKGTLDMVRDFRKEDDETPIVLMGYFNPVLSCGPGKFIEDAAKAGVDGLILVDLPPEEDAELRALATAAGIDVIRLVTPTTDEARLPKVLEGASGFLYYVSVTGVTGAARADAQAVADHLSRIRAATDLPVAVGFGIKTPDDARALARSADAVVVGSGIVSLIAAETGSAPERVASYVSTLAAGLGTPPESP